MDVMYLYIIYLFIYICLSHALFVRLSAVCRMNSITWIFRHITSFSFPSFFFHSFVPKRCTCSYNRKIFDWNPCVRPTISIVQQYILSTHIHSFYHVGNFCEWWRIGMLFSSIVRLFRTGAVQMHRRERTNKSIEIMFGPYWDT